MKRVAITGATGFVGGHAAERLSRHGYEVVAFGRRPGTRHISWDIASGPLVDPPEVDVVVHCAANVDDWASYDDSHLHNVCGTMHVLESFPRAKRFIFVSSTSVYDPFQADERLPETARCGNFLNAYSRTKWEAERVVEDATAYTRVILRPHIVYGPGDTTIVPRLLQARRFGRFIVLGNGTNRVSITHIENLCEAIQLSIEADLSSDSHIFNIADTEEDTVDSLLSAIKVSFGIRDPLIHIPRSIAYGLGQIAEIISRFTRRENPPLITRYVVAQMAYAKPLDISRAREALGYTPKRCYRDAFGAGYNPIP